MVKRLSSFDLADMLRAIANQGLAERSTERLAIADVLERVTRIEARLDDFLNRADVLLSQSVGKR